MRDRVFYTIDLTPYYNKQIVFSRNEIGDGMGNDGVGIDVRTFYALDKSIDIDGVEYVFRQNNTMDCVICNNQNIVLPPISFQRFHVLGFMFWGDNHDYFRLQYEGDRAENAKVYFADWSRTHNIWNNSEEYKTQGIKTVEVFFSCGNAKIPIYLHHCEYVNKAPEKLQSIILPDNMYMYIFAITLECGK